MVAQPPPHTMGRALPPTPPALPKFGAPLLIPPPHRALHSNPPPPHRALADHFMNFYSALGIMLTAKDVEPSSKLASALAPTVFGVVAGRGRV